MGGGAGKQPGVVLALPDDDDRTAAKDEAPTRAPSPMDGSTDDASLDTTPTTGGKKRKSVTFNMPGERPEPSLMVESVRSDSKGSAQEGGARRGSPPLGAGIAAYNAERDQASDDARHPDAARSMPDMAMRDVRRPPRRRATWTESQETRAVGERRSSLQLGAGGAAYSTARGWQAERDQGLSTKEETTMSSLLRSYTEAAQRQEEKMRLRAGAGPGAGAAVVDDRTGRSGSKRSESQPLLPGIDTRRRETSPAVVAATRQRRPSAMAKHPGVLGLVYG